MSDPFVRRAAPADAVPFARLQRECFLQAYGHASTPERIARFLDHTYAPDRVHSELCDPQLPTWILQTAEGDWAGFGRLNLAAAKPESVPGRQPVQLQRFYFRARYHGSGLAAQLMHFLKVQARALGADQLWLTAWKEAPQALRFYAKHHFCIQGSIPFMIEDDAKDDWVLAAPL